MKTNISLRSFAGIIAAISCATFSLTSRAAELSPENKEFLAKYEKVRAALAADNLDKAKKAAADLGDEGSALSKTDKIKTARDEFSKLSEHAIKVAAGQDGYYIVNCPMLQKDW